MSRAQELKKYLDGARHKGEAFSTYRKRRTAANLSVEVALAGRMAHESTRGAIIRAKDWTPEHQEALARGKIVRMGLTKTGDYIVRTKGVTYRKAA